MIDIPRATKKAALIVLTSIWLIDLINVFMVSMVLVINNYSILVGR